jgi:ABC-type transporter MlaC component
VNCLARFRRNVLVGGVVFLLVLCCRPATAQTDPRIKEILTSINKNIPTLAGKSESQASKICTRIVPIIIDMEAIARGASTHIWDGMSPQQRNAYRAAALRWVVRNCVQRNRDNNGNPLQFVGIRQGEAGNRLLVTRSNQPSHVIMWRLRGAGRLRAVDLILDGVSMTLSLRDEMNTLLDRNNNDINMAIKSLGR